MIFVIRRPEVFDLFAHVVSQFRLSAEDWRTDELVVGPWAFDKRVVTVAKLTWARVGDEALGEEILQDCANDEPWIRTYHALEGLCDESVRGAIAAMILALFYTVGEITAQS